MKRLLQPAKQDKCPFQKVHNLKLTCIANFVNTKWSGNFTVLPNIEIRARNYNAFLELRKS